MASEWDPPNWFSWLAGVFASLVGLLTAWVWKVRSAIEEVRQNSDDRISGVEKGMQQNLESSVRIIQKDLNEIKDLVHENAVFVRDNFARRDSVHAMTNELRSSLDKRLDRLEQDMQHDRTYLHDAVDNITNSFNDMNRTLVTLLEQNSGRRR